MVGAAAHEGRGGTWLRAVLNPVLVFSSLLWQPLEYSETSVLFPRPVTVRSPHLCLDTVVTELLSGGRSHSGAQSAAGGPSAQEAEAETGVPRAALPPKALRANLSLALLGLVAPGYLHMSSACHRITPISASICLPSSSKHSL